MSAALGLLLVSQLNSFQFSPIESPQYAGARLKLTIIARDLSGGIYPFNGNALLSTTRDDYWSYVRPSVITFYGGVWTDSVTVTLADTLALRCTEPSRQISDTSNSFQVFSGPPSRLLTILPGEIAAPGSPTGRLPREPEPHLAGDSFNFTVSLTDTWFNPVRFRSDSVYFSASDSFAVLPAGGSLTDGSATFPATFRTAGTQRLAVRPASGLPFRPDTSTSFAVNPGPFSRPLLLLPGENHLPGDTASQPWQTPGKTGQPQSQYLREPFSATVYACDRCWNRVTGPGDDVSLQSDFSFSAVPTEASLRDSVVFNLQFNSAGPNQNIWVREVGGLYESYRTHLEVKARGRQLEVTAPDTVRAGETAYVRVRVLDANSLPVVAAVCRFAVIRGNGDMLDGALLTDTLGFAAARFLCTRARFAEHDTVRVNAGIVDSFVGIYVQIPDSVVMKGGVIAVPNPFGFNRQGCEIYYYLQRSAPMTVAIYDPFGNEVITWRFSQGQPGALSGVNRIVWDGRNRHGRRVANGIYVVHVLGQLHTGTTFNNTCRIGVAW
uniref:FlgD/Vpr Ig-like domain-containing protein n=1 Tax=candidate division WOR-3 bacterium TaxID=2052148 RepID=A0A7C4GFB0_UNCW3